MYLASPWNAPAPAAVRVTRPTVCDITDSVTIRGQVAELRRSELFARGLSVVERVYVRAGQQVRLGDPLLRLRLTDDPQQRSAALRADLQTAAEALGTLDAAQAEALAQSLWEQMSEDAAQKDTQVYTLYSELSGTVMDVDVVEGEGVSPLFPCVTVSDLSALCVRAQADEAAVKKLKEGQTCRVTVSALSEDAATGRVSAVSPYATASLSLLGESAVRTEVLIELEAGHGLRPGYSAKVRVSTDNCKDAVLVPMEAIAQDEEQREYVMVLRDGRACKQILTTRYDLEDSIEALEGVSPGDLLIWDPASVFDGQEVRADEIP